jgi:hypothetical protein
LVTKTYGRGKYWGKASARICRQTLPLAIQEMLPQNKPIAANIKSSKINGKNRFAPRLPPSFSFLFLLVLDHS